MPLRAGHADRRFSESGKKTGTAFRDGRVCDTDETAGAEISSGTGADGTSGNNEATIDANKGKTNPEKLTADNDGKVTQKFYLQHGQEIRIEGIAKATEYNVTENKEDYKSEGAAVAGYTDPVNGTIQKNDLKTSYLNTRNGVIPTGVVMTVAPFAVAVILGGAGVVTFAGRKKREDEK